MSEDLVPWHFSFPGVYSAHTTPENEEVFSPHPSEGYKAVSPMAGDLI